MGLIRANIELISGDDLALARKGVIKKEEVKKVKIKALVDSGAYMLVINENIKRQLDLEVLSKETALLADGSERELEIVGPIEVRFKTRRTTVDAMVVPNNAEVLLGAIPLEGMDVLIDPNKQELQLPPERPYIAQTILKGVR
ncbi:MAG: clan AA aspartic protease [Bacteroidota bacterium]